MFSDAALSIQSSFIRDILAVSQQPNMLSLAGGMPATELLPWQQLQQHVDKLKIDDLQYSLTPGVPALREHICQALITDCDTSAEQVMITTGSQQGLDLVARTLLNPGDKVIVEAPTFLGALQTFQAASAEILEVETDAEGPIIESLKALLERHSVKCIYLQPNFQNPTGLSYSLARREALAKLAKAFDVLIVEDDPYGALRYQGEVLPSLYSLAPKHCIRLVSFSKTVAPGLRLGWLQAKDEIQQQLTKFKQVGDLHSSSLNQQMLLFFLQSPEFDQHLAALKKTYGERWKAMNDALTEHLSDVANWQQPDGGMFYWLNIKSDEHWKQLFDQAIAQNVAYVPGAAFYASELSKNTLRLSFSNVSPENIQTAIKRLAAVLNEPAVA